jgi:FkbM family methyltransferase
MAHLAHLYPSSHIYGVEMNLENFLLAKKNLSPLEKQCKIIHAAIWFENGQVSYGGNAEWGYSIVRDSAENKSTQTKVDAKTIDSIFEENNLKKVDYLKMDIEGAEKFVLQNPQKWIYCVKSMKVEVHPPVTLEECEKILTDHGFRCHQDKTSTLPTIVAIRQS